VELLNPGTHDLYGVTILELDREFRLTGRLDARRAHWTAGGWELSEGAYRKIGAEGKVQTVAFGRTALDLKEELEDFVRYVALAFARADLRPPLIAAWTANVIFMGIGVSLLLRART
jgi:hypothetical protein